LFRDFFSVFYENRLFLSYTDICTILNNREQIISSEISNIPSEELEIFLKDFSSFLSEEVGI
jgi:hypothetical protein